MPELPEVYTIVAELKKTVVGKTIKEIEVRVPKMVVGERGQTVGHKVIDVSRRAKLIIIKLSGGMNMAVHLKLTGQLFYLASGASKTKAGEGENKFTHIIFHFTDGSQLLFNDLRKFGYVKILTDQELEANLKRENYGPEPLESGFILDEFKKILASRSRSPIKPLLMDQTAIAGIGNIYSDEALFYAGIHPLRKAGEIRPAEAEKLFEGIKKVLRQAIKYQGTSIDTYRRTTGEKGTFVPHLQVYRREGEPCPRCGTKIKRIKVGGRSAHFCPRCQK